MSIFNYGKKLVKEGALICNSELETPYNYHGIWAPDFMESIVFVRSNKDNYISVLHFFWSAIFHEREVKNQQDAEEIFAATHLYKTTQEDVWDKIKSISLSWLQTNEKLLPKSKWNNIIWEEKGDIAILLEDDNYYYLWAWDLTKY